MIKSIYCDVEECNALVIKNSLVCSACNTQYSIRILYNNYAYKKFQTIIEQYRTSIEDDIQLVMDEWDLVFEPITSTVKRYYRYRDESILDKLKQSDNQTVKEFIRLGGLDVIDHKWMDRVTPIFIAIITRNSPISYEYISKYNNYSDPSIRQSICNLRMFRDQSTDDAWNKIIDKVLDVDETIEYKLNSLQRGVVSEYVEQEVIHEILGDVFRLSYLGDTIPTLIVLLSLDINSMRIHMLDMIDSNINIKVLKSISTFYSRLLKNFG